MNEEKIIAITDKIFFEKNNVSKHKVFNLLNDTLKDCDDGEIYFENSDSETFFFDDGRMKNVSYDNSQGFGIRSILGEIRGYAHSGEINEKNIRKAAETVRSVSNNYSGTKKIPTHNFKNEPLYTNQNPLEAYQFNKKVKLLQNINEYARNLDNRVVQVSISLSGSQTSIQILNSDQSSCADIRPLVRLNIQVVVEENNKRESGTTAITIPAPPAQLP